MATTAALGHDREVSIGRIFSRGFGTIAAHPVMSLGLALVFGALPSMLVLAAQARLLPLLPFAWIVAVAFAGIVIDMGFAAVNQGVLVLAVVAHDEGRPVDIAETLPPALMRLVPLVLLGLIIGFGFVFGLVLVIVPGVVISVIWWVAAPALVVERLGVIDALRRSASLTAGARWKVFGIELVLGVASWILVRALQAAGVTWMTDLQGGFGLHDLSLWALVLTALVQTVSYAVSAAMHASCYVELRNWKEGPAADALADVFG